MLQYLSLLPLVGRPVASLTIDELAQVREVMGLDVVLTPEVHHAVLSFLDGRGVKVVSDLVKDPKLTGELVKFVTNKPAAERKRVMRCSACENFYFQTGGSDCPHCTESYS